MAPDIFWGLTPWQFKICLEAHQDKVQEDRDHSAYLMWHGAMLGRAETLPPLKDYLINPIDETEPKIDEISIKARLMEYNKRVKNDDSS